MSWSLAAKIEAAGDLIVAKDGVDAVSDSFASDDVAHGTDREIKGRGGLRGTMKQLSENMLRCVNRGDLAGVEALLKSGEIPNAVDSDGRTALICALIAFTPNRDVVAMLVRAGTDVNIRDRGQRWAALAFAARDWTPDICRMILDAGAEVDAVDTFGNTALWRAVQAQNDAVVDLLISRGADPDRKNNSGISPRGVAERSGRTLSGGD